MVAACLETEAKLSREMDGWVAAYKEEYIFQREYSPKFA